MPAGWRAGVAPWAGAAQGVTAGRGGGEEPLAHPTPPRPAASRWLGLSRRCEGASGRFAAGTGSAPTHHGRAVSVVCWPVAAGAVPFWCVVCQSKGRVFFGAHRRRPWAGARRDCQWVSAASVQAASSRRQPLAAAPAGATLSRLLRFWGCCVDESRDRVTPSDCRGSVSYPPMTAFQSTAAATARTLRRPRSLFLLLLSFVLVLPPHDCASHVSSDNQVCSSVSTAAATVVPDRARWFL